MTPPPDDKKELTPLARALGRIPSGLYVVTTEAPAQAGGGPLGFVGSFVIQVGFDPPTICVAVGAGRDHLAAMRGCGRFAISVLDEASSGVMGEFFKKREDGSTPFDDLATSKSAAGSTVLSDALAWVDCEISGEHETGDHVVVFGRAIEGAITRDGAPKMHTRKNGLGY